MIHVNARKRARTFFTQSSDPLLASLPLRLSPPLATVSESVTNTTGVNGAFQMIGTVLGSHVDEVYPLKLSKVGRYLIQIHNPLFVDRFMPTFVPPTLFLNSWVQRTKCCLSICWAIIDCGVCKPSKPETVMNPKQMRRHTALLPSTGS